MRLIFALLAFVFAPLAAHAETAILAGGCFWCVESDFESVPGVTDVISGYTGGNIANPTYEDVKSETSGHYEAVKVTFNPNRITYAEIVSLFLRSIDVVDAGGQFCDRGESYRSAIFVKDAGQQATAAAEVARAGKDLGRKVVTPILPAAKFWKAEDYHQNYYKGTDWVVTRRGPKVQADAYAFYRKACGRDARVRALWGSAAAFAH